MVYQHSLIAFTSGRIQFILSQRRYAKCTRFARLTFASHNFTTLLYRVNARYGRRKDGASAAIEVRAILSAASLYLFGASATAFYCMMFYLMRRYSDWAIRGERGRRRLFHAGFEVGRCLTLFIYRHAIPFYWAFSASNAILDNQTMLMSPSQYPRENSTYFPQTYMILPEKMISGNYLAKVDWFSIYFRSSRMPTPMATH